MNINILQEKINNKGKREQQKSLYNYEHNYIKVLPYEWHKTTKNTIGRLKSIFQHAKWNTCLTDKIYTV